MAGKKIKDTDAYVGRRVRSRRLELKMSQEALAKFLDLSFQQIQKYENGTNRISASCLFDLARALNVQISYFFEGLETKRPNDQYLSTEFFAIKSTHRLAECFLKLSPNARNSIVVLAETLSK